MAYFALSCFSSLPFLFFLLMCLVVRAVVGEPAYVYSLCPNLQTVGPSSTYQANVNTLLSFLSSNTTDESRFYNTTVGSQANEVYGAFFCRVDQTSAFCHDCVSLAIDSLNTHCSGKKETTVWYDQCLVRYSNESFFGIMSDAPMIPLWNRQNAVDIRNVTSNETYFMQVLLETLGNASSQAAAGSSGTKFATKEGNYLANLTSRNTIYTLAECTPDISVNDCNTCLQLTIGNMTELCNMKAGCTMMSPNCNMRYDVYPFYGDARDALSPSSGPSSVPFSQGIPEVVTPASSKGKTSLIVGIAISAALAMMILLGIFILAYKRKVNKTNRDDEEEIEIVESLKFNLATIRKATNNFSANNKLGEGGFGQVYKGKLENGEHIAIKRLSTNSKQGIGEFKTEVVLLAKLQHRNLAKLLGFCLSSKEKILVYEFLPNMSLDRFLSDPTKRASLEWKTRFKIIVGIARGLLYLHEDSRLKIVHRDLKPSNILLDEAMNPKIADFGMAKLFGVDQTQDNTDRIVGTFGYMAPEYLIAGHFSVKSDVYGFGVIILELVSGIRNKYLSEYQHNESLLYRAWTVWDGGIPLKLIDPTLSNNICVEEITKCVHIGLLCIQEDAAKRPRMASIVSALNGESITLPLPTLPFFLTGSVDNGVVVDSSSDQSARVTEVAEDITELFPR